MKQRCIHAIAASPIAFFRPDISILGARGEVVERTVWCYATSICTADANYDLAMKLLPFEGGCSGFTGRLADSRPSLGMLDLIYDRSILAKGDASKPNAVLH